MTQIPSPGVRIHSAAPVKRRINTAIIKDTHRHSQIVALLRWALPIACLLVIGVFLFSSGILQSFLFPVIKDAPPVVAENTVEMVQPRMSGLDKKLRAYEITAEKATQNTDDPTKVTLENLSGSLVLNQNDNKISLTAKTGIIDTETNFLQLRQDIIITSKQGYTAYLLSADAKLKEKYVTSSDPILIEWEEGSIKANGLEIKDDGNVIRFLNRVKVKIRPKPEKRN